MAEDFLEIIEAELARVLRSIDRVCMLAYHLQDHPEQGDSRFEARRHNTVNRAIAIREAIQKAGVQLPPLRSIEEREAQGQPREHGYSIPQIARLAGVDRTKVISWLRGLNGSIGEKVDEAVRTREPPIFTSQEAQTILRAGGLVTRPAERARHKREIPTDKEIRLIESAASGWLAAAIVLMSQTHLRHFQK